MIVDSCGQLENQTFNAKKWQIAGKIRKIAKIALFNLIFYYSQSD